MAKKGRSARGRPSVFELLKDLLYNRNVDSLGAFFALIEVELNGLILIETTETVALDAGVVNENVLTFFGRHEAITFGCVEPFYFAFHKE
jgi:hypothetical protein